MSKQKNNNMPKDTKRSFVDKLFELEIIFGDEFNYTLHAGGTYTKEQAEIVLQSCPNYKYALIIRPYLATEAAAQPANAAAAQPAAAQSKVTVTEAAANGIYEISKVTISNFTISCNTHTKIEHLDFRLEQTQIMTVISTEESEKGSVSRKYTQINPTSSKSYDLLLYALIDINGEYNDNTRLFNTEAYTKACSDINKARFPPMARFPPIFPKHPLLLLEVHHSDHHNIIYYKILILA